MRSIEQIKAASAEAASAYAQTFGVPLVLEKEDKPEEFMHGIPDLRGLQCFGWEVENILELDLRKVNTKLTARDVWKELCSKAKVGYGYGIVKGGAEDSIGWIGEFKKLRV